MDERRHLEEMWPTAQSIERIRIQIVIASSEGATSAEIAQRVGWTPRAVRRVLQRFNACGVSGVYDKRHMNPGRHRIVTEEWQGHLLALIEESPSICGCPTERWTAKLLSSELALRQGIYISEERVRHYLRRNGYRFGSTGWCRDVEYCAPMPMEPMPMDSTHMDVDVAVDAVALTGDAECMAPHDALTAKDEHALDC